MNTPSAPDNAVSSEPRSPDAVDRPNSRKHLLLSRPPPVIRVAILDDHPVVALGLGAYLDARPGFRTKFCDLQSNSRDPSRNCSRSR